MSEHKERVFVPGHGFRDVKPARVAFAKSSGATKRFTLGEIVQVLDKSGNLVMAEIVSKGNRSNPPMAKSADGELIVLNGYGFSQKLAAGE